MKKFDWRSTGALMACRGPGAGRVYVRATTTTSDDDRHDRGTTEDSGGRPASSGTGVTEDSIKIAYTFVDTEALQAMGIEVFHGPYADIMQALVDDLNADGGINGRTRRAAQRPRTTRPAATRSPSPPARRSPRTSRSSPCSAALQGEANLCIVEQHSTALVGGRPDRRRSSSGPGPVGDLGSGSRPSASRPWCRASTPKASSTAHDRRRLRARQGPAHHRRRHGGPGGRRRRGGLRGRQRRRPRRPDRDRRSGRHPRPAHEATRGSTPSSSPDGTSPVRSSTRTTSTPALWVTDNGILTVFAGQGGLTGVPRDPGRRRCARADRLGQRARCRSASPSTRRPPARRRPRPRMAPRTRSHRAPPLIDACSAFTHLHGGRRGRRRDPQQRDLPRGSSRSASSTLPGDARLLRARPATRAHRVLPLRPEPRLRGLRLGRPGHPPRERRVVPGRGLDPGPAGVAPPNATPAAPTFAPRRADGRHDRSRCRRVGFRDVPGREGLADRRGGQLVDGCDRAARHPERSGDRWSERRPWPHQGVTGPTAVCVPCGTALVAIGTTAIPTRVHQYRSEGLSGAGHVVFVDLAHHPCTSRTVGPAGSPPSRTELVPSPGSTTRRPRGTAREDASASWRINCRSRPAAPGNIVLVTRNPLIGVAGHARYPLHFWSTGAKVVP